MKKITFLVAALCATMFVNAAVETYTYVSGDGTSVVDGDDRTYTSTNFSFLHEVGTASNAIVPTYAELRIYQGHTMTVTPLAAGKKITAIEVTVSASKYVTPMEAATITAGTSEVTATAYTGTISKVGEVVTFDFSGVTACEYVKFVLNAQARTVSWKITYTEGAPTAIDQVTAPLSIYATGGRIYGAENARIYTILGMDVTEQNGNLNGIYVVKANGKTQKIAVK